MTYRITSILISLIGSMLLGAQNITGNMSQLSNQEIKLEGFNGFTSYPISATIADSTGNFNLHYSKTDNGVGYLISAEKKRFFVILSGEEIEIVGEKLSDVVSIKIKKGQENKWFEQYTTEHPKREQALSAWRYLENIYTSDSLFSKQQIQVNNIQVEKQRIRDEDAAFLANFPEESYVSWFLPTRKLVSSVSRVAQYHTEDIPATIATFRAIDYTYIRLYKSGLLRDVIDSHFWLIENSGRSLDSVFIDMNTSIDRMVKNLLKDEAKLNEVTSYLFELLEKRSLFTSSEYLALKLLNQKACTLNADFAAQLESYRAMKKGSIAPDIVFNGDVVKNGTAIETPSKLSDIPSAYKVVIFGASWCPNCIEELRTLLSLYRKWQSKGIELVFVSLDTDKDTFRNFTSVFPFISNCDYKKWNNKAVKDYYVFASPTLFLLDNNQKIIMRPNSAKHIDAWVDLNLAQGNKL